MTEAAGSAYSSNAQRARVITEAWAQENMFCPSCGSIVVKAPNNLPATDFYCGDCNDSFELKSRRGKHGATVVNGAYGAMISRILEDSQPNLILLGYDKDFRIENLSVIPRFFLVPEIVQKRKPLGIKAKRAGWIGCNLLIGNIPTDGRIEYVTSSAIAGKEKVRERWDKVRFVQDMESHSRGWLVAVMATIQDIGKEEFTLSEVYAYASIFERMFPTNNHVKAKIRQQLQYLRDNEWIAFRGRGVYIRTPQASS